MLSKRTLPLKLANSRWGLQFEAEECPNLATAMARADALARIPGNAGVVAYCRTFDLDRGISGEAVIVKRLGQLPDDLSMLF